jgi:hypothetical protein
MAPEHTSPKAEEEKPLEMAGDLAEAQEAWLARTPAERATFMAWTLDDALKGKRSVFATTRAQSRALPTDKTSTPEWAGKEHLAAPKSTEPAVEAGGEEVNKLAQNVPQKAATPEPEVPHKDDTSNAEEDLDSLEQTTAYWGATNPPPNIHVGMD